MHDEELDFRRKIIQAKLLLDTFEVPKRPVTLSAHQYKKKFGSNQGYSKYKSEVKEARKEWDLLYKDTSKLLKRKIKNLTQINLSDEALQHAEAEAIERQVSVPDILGEWLEAGRLNSIG